MEFLEAEIIDKNGERTGVFKNIYIDRINILDDSEENDVYKLEGTNEIIKLIHKSGEVYKEFEWNKDGDIVRLKTFGQDI